MSHQNPNMLSAMVEALSFSGLADPPRWTGRLQLPGKPNPIDILIFNIEGEFWGVPSLCSHQGYDLKHCPLSSENNLICPAHGQRIEPKTTGFPVKEYNGQFLVFIIDMKQLGTAENKTGARGDYFETLNQLREEVEQLRRANLKQERQVLVITQTMDAMLSESEGQKAKL